MRKVHCKLGMRQAGCSLALELQASHTVILKQLTELEACMKLFQLEGCMKRMVGYKLVLQQGQYKMGCRLEAQGLYMGLFLVLRNFLENCKLVQ